MTADFDAMRARHVPTGIVVLDGDHCDLDLQSYPCDFIVADDARRRLVEAARGWLAYFDSQASGLSVADVERALVERVRAVLAESES